MDSYRSIARRFVRGEPTERGWAKSGVKGDEKHMTIEFYAGRGRLKEIIAVSQLLAVSQEDRGSRGGKRLVHVRADLNQAWGGKSYDKTVSYFLNEIVRQAQEAGIEVWAMDEKKVGIGVLNGPAHKKWKKKQRVVSPAELKRREEAKQQRAIERAIKNARKKSPVYSYDEAVGF